MPRVRRSRKPQPVPETPLEALLEIHLDDLRVRNYSEYTLKNRRVHIGFFLAWCRERGITDPIEVTRTVLESYQRHVFHYRKKNGEPLAFTGQHERIVPLRVWFRWMARNHHILHNPASELELPRLGIRLPKAVLTAKEAEQILVQPDIRDPLGLRDRAILEALYSTGMRRLELVSLKILGSRFRTRHRHDPPGQREKGSHHSPRPSCRAVDTQVPGRCASAAGHRTR
jgi:integrase/recombinase XerD